MFLVGKPVPDLDRKIWLHLAETTSRLAILIGEYSLHKQTFTRGFPTLEKSS